MPFEAFLGLLKLLCENSNYKTPPYTVAVNWAMARRLGQKNQKASVLSAEVTPCSQVVHKAELLREPSQSHLLCRLSRSDDHNGMVSARFVSKIVRDEVEMRVGRWLFFAAGNMQRIAYVEEMAEASFLVSSRLRLWCSHSRSDFSESSDGMIRLKKDAASNKSILIRLEEVAVTELLTVDRGDHWEMRYVW